MNKYIPADKLKAEIGKGTPNKIELLVYRDIILSLIDSLQQEQPEVQNGKFVFPKYLYARTKDNKTIDMSYAPQDMTAIEYIRNDFVEPEVDLDKEIEMYISSSGLADYAFLVPSIARHFYERGMLNAMKQ